MVNFLRDKERYFELRYHENEYCSTVRLHLKCRGNKDRKDKERKKL